MEVIFFKILDMKEGKKREIVGIRMSCILMSGLYFFVFCLMLVLLFLYFGGKEIWRGGMNVEWGRS